MVSSAEGIRSKRIALRQAVKSAAALNPARARSRLKNAPSPQRIRFRWRKIDGKMNGNLAGTSQVPDERLVIARHFPISASFPLMSNISVLMTRLLRGYFGSSSTCYSRLTAYTAVKSTIHHDVKSYVFRAREISTQRETPT